MKPTRAALVSEGDLSVTNILEYDPLEDGREFSAPAGFRVVPLSEGSPVALGWVYDSVSNTFAAPAGA